MVLGRNALIGLGFLLFSVGCTETNTSQLDDIDIPKLAAVDYVDQADLVYSIQCELGETVRSIAARGKSPSGDVDFAVVLNQTALITMELKGVENRGIGLSGTFVIPVGSSGLTLGTSGGTSRKSTATSSFEIVINKLSDLTDCPSIEQSQAEYAALSAEEKLKKPKRLRSEVGIGTPITEIANTLRKIRRYPKSVTYSAVFEVDRNGKFEPSLKRVSSENPPKSQTVGFSGSNSRTLTHTFTIAVSDFNKPAPKTSIASSETISELRRASQSLRLVNALERFAE